MHSPTFLYSLLCSTYTLICKLTISRGYSIRYPRIPKPSARLSAVVQSAGLEAYERSVILAEAVRRAVFVMNGANPLK